MNGKDDEIYFIPGKYTGEEIPSDDYVTVTNLDRDFASAVFSKNNVVLIRIDGNPKVIQRSSREVIKLYNDDLANNDSLYTCFDGRDSVYKKGVHFINMNLKENYAWNSEGKLK
ncbi:hypothetical protein DCO56_10540 [Sphingobacterium athyrii]|uniref:Uncharacterized protein n=2 Tax=Sphingobacterium athyrii TaxID=2152717 RepID=A0A363NT31_9SPHI|nr:hypothetical protein DCO56_10540 [Sphingobacterium athyrii]